MQRKIYFELSELKQAVLQMTIPAAIYNEGFSTVCVNENYKIQIGSDKGLDTFLNADNINKIYTSRDEKSIAQFEIRKDAVTICKFEMQWIRCVYSQDYYCIVYSVNGDDFAGRKYFSELSLIYTNLDKLKALTKEHEEFVTKFSNNINIEYIKNNYKQYRKISTDIELLTKLMNEVWPIKNDYYNCYTVLNNIIDEYKKVKTNRKATFKINTNTKDTIIYCDTRYMSEALINVFLNILQFSSSFNTTVHIDIESTVTHTYIDIYSARLLLDENTVYKTLYEKKITSGSNDCLGLYIANSIILRHNGTLEFKSDAQVGTKVSIKLPQNNFETFTFNQDPVNPDFSYVNEMASTAFSLL